MRAEEAELTSTVQTPPIQGPAVQGVESRTLDACHSSSGLVSVY